MTQLIVGEIEIGERSHVEENAGIGDVSEMVAGEVQVNEIRAHPVHGAEAEAIQRSYVVLGEVQVLQAHHIVQNIRRNNFEAIVRDREVDEDILKPS